MNKNNIFILNIENALSKIFGITIKSKIFVIKKLQIIYAILIFLNDNYIIFDCFKSKKECTCIYIKLIKRIIDDIKEYQLTNVNIVFDIINILIGNGVIINDKQYLNKIKDNKLLVKCVKEGKCDWDMRYWNDKIIRNTIGDIIPIDISKIILGYVCLWN